MRQPFFQSVRLETTRGQLIVEGLDLSATGIRCCTDRQLDTNQRYTILADFGKGQVMASVPARTIWCNRRDDGQYEVGFAFERELQDPPVG